MVWACREDFAAEAVGLAVAAGITRVTVASERNGLGLRV